MSVLCSNTYIQFCNILSRVSGFQIYIPFTSIGVPDGQTSLFKFKLSCPQAAASGEAAPCRATLEGKVDCFTRFAGLYIILLLQSSESDPPASPAPRVSPGRGPAGRVNRPSQLSESAV